MTFNASLSQDFTITADTKEAAEYALLYRVARYANLEGIDEKHGHYKAEAKAAKIDSLIEKKEDAENIVQTGYGGAIGARISRMGSAEEYIPFKVDELDIF